jgi:hypothetical protein
MLVLVGQTAARFSSCQRAANSEMKLAIISSLVISPLKIVFKLVAFLIGNSSFF